MSTTDPHEPTAQEDAIYQALTDGDQDAIQELHDQALEAGELEQYQEDYQYAHARYQADHEAPEDEREAQTAEQVTDENQTAASL